MRKINLKIKYDKTIEKLIDAHLGDLRKLKSEAYVLVI